MEWKTITKLLRHRRHLSTAATTTATSGELKLKKLKTFFSQPLEINTHYKEEETKKQELEALLAGLFATISAIKASYAQLQVAQSPYDPETIQLLDRCIVSELKKISELKQSYLKNQISVPTKHDALNAEILEQKNLIKTFQVTVKKLESEIEAKDSEASFLRLRLSEIESKLHPENNLFCLHNVHVSGLNSKHFLVVLRFVLRSVRDLVRIMVKEMENAEWDLDSACYSIHRVCLRPENRKFAFESYVCGKMFSDFHAIDFKYDFLKHRSSWNQHLFFNEFQELKFLQFDEIVKRKSEFRGFCIAKYSGLVHPKLEEVVSGSGFVSAFNEMAKRVWLLHCLFYSFGSELNRSVFQVKNGSRFSEVYMESVADGDPIRDEGIVGFMVVPGFKVGSTLMQSKVYLCNRE